MHCKPARPRLATVQFCTPELLVSGVKQTLEQWEGMLLNRLLEVYRLHARRINDEVLHALFDSALPFSNAPTFRSTARSLLLYHFE